MIKTILATLLATAIITSAAAIVKVNVIDNDIAWIKQSLSKIEIMLDRKECR